MCLGKLQANAPPVCGTMVELGWLENAKNRWKMPQNDQNTTFLTLLGCQVVLRWTGGPITKCALQKSLISQIYRQFPNSAAAESTRALGLDNT